MSRKSYPVGSSASVLRKASLIKRLALLRQTLFPTFLLTDMPNLFSDNSFFITYITKHLLAKLLPFL